MPATSGLQGRAILMFRSVGFLQVSQNQPLSWVGMATGTNGESEKICFKSLKSFQ